VEESRWGGVGGGVRRKWGMSHMCMLLLSLYIATELIQKHVPLHPYVHAFLRMCKYVCVCVCVCVSVYMCLCVIHVKSRRIPALLCESMCVRVTCGCGFVLVCVRE